MTSFIRKWSQATKLIHNNFLILVLDFFFYFPIQLLIKLNPFVNLLIILISIGWSGAKIEYIATAYRNHPIPWRKTPRQILKFAKILLPPFFLLSMIIGLLLLLLLFLFPTTSIQKLVQPPSTNLSQSLLLIITTSTITLFFVTWQIIYINTKQFIFQATKTTSIFISNNLKIFVPLFLIILTSNAIIVLTQPSTLEIIARLSENSNSKLTFLFQRFFLQAILLYLTTISTTLITTSWLKKKPQS